MKRILIIEDDPSTRYLCEAILSKEQYEVVAVSSAASGEKLLAQESYDLLLLDLNLPDADGIEVSTRVSQQNPEMPILIMTIRQDADQRMAGFTSGAQDYMVKPFHPGELLHRITQLIGRSSALVADHQEGVSVSGLRFNFEQRCLFDHSGERIRLTEGEFALISCLVSASGRAVSRWTLLDEVTQGERDGHPRTVDVLVSRLRKKIEKDPKNPKILLTVKGFGYQLQLESR